MISAKYNFSKSCLLKLFTNYFSTRVRFAPSPTGYLHIGGLKSALINYLFAKSTNGTFILRIEDTDRTRYVHDSIEHIIKCLQWSRINVDEGLLEHGRIDTKYLQSNRLKIYNSKATELIKQGCAYRCFCSKERLEFMKREQQRLGENQGYDGKCRHLTASEVEMKLNNEEMFVVRLNMNNSKDSAIIDLIHGKIETPRIEFDPVILKSDGFPVYHFANVIDDHYMKITHVIRGQEWLTATPLHLYLYQSLQWMPPKYAHLPLTMKSDGQKISKRDLTSKFNVNNLINSGYHGDIIKSWLMSTGGGLDCDWSPDMTESDIIKHFDLSKISTHNARISESQLSQCGKYYWSKLKLTETYFNDHIQPYLTNHKINVSYHQFQSIFPTIQHRVSCLNDFLTYSFFWNYNVDNINFNILVNRLQSVSNSNPLQLLDNFTNNLLNHVTENVKDPFINIERTFDNLIPKSAAFACIRLIMTYHEAGLRINELFNLLGSKELVERIRQFRNVYCKNLESFDEKL